MEYEVPAVEIRDVVKKFGSFTAIRRATLSIRDNEFFTLLGPSGCGKTTLLRLIAGFEDTSEGEILLFGEQLRDLPPHRRPVNTVFQNYALFPHMTVSENVAFGLRMKGLAKPEIAARVEQMLKLVRLQDFAERHPGQLSGGQQQRAALVRAIAPGPKVLLLDEPLSALDLKLRQAMRIELKQLQQETGITFVFVTHDQEEALTMSDRIAVMSDGVIQQIGEAHAIYENPVNQIVAEFIGETNLLEVTVARVIDKKCELKLSSGLVLRCHTDLEVQEGHLGHALVRPEKIHIRDIQQAKDLPVGKVIRSQYLGTDTQYEIQLQEGPTLTVRRQNRQVQLKDIKLGTEVAVELEADAVRLLTD